LSSTGDVLCGDCGGDVPHVAVWDEFGNGYGEVVPKKGDKIKLGGSKTFQVPRSPGIDESSQQPEYVMLTMDGDNAICFTHIIASGHSAQWTWFGDLGYKCCVDWYNNHFKFGDGTYVPKCVWLDKNHSDKLHFSGMALHMPDVAGSEQGKVNEYQKDPDTLCKSTRRMGFFPSMPDYGEPLMFLPPLNYTTDGADLDFNWVKDKVKSRARRSEEQGNSLLRRRGTSNPQLRHLVVSGHEGHSAKDLCDSGSSYGPDFVSTVENTYCDMSAKKAWPLCDRNGVKDNCFDLQKQTMRKGGKMRRDQGNPEAKKYVMTRLGEELQPDSIAYLVGSLFCLDWGSGGL